MIHRSVVRRCDVACEATMHFRALNPVFEPVVGVSEYAAASLLEVLYILDQFKSIAAAAHEYFEC